LKDSDSVSFTFYILTNIMQPAASVPIVLNAIKYNFNIRETSAANHSE